MTNGSAIGYMIIAAKRLGLKPEQIRQLERAMYEAMDEHTEYEALKEYQNT